MKLRQYSYEKAINKFNQVIRLDPFQAYIYVFLASQVTDLEEIEFGDWKCHRYLKQD